MDAHARPCRAPRLGRALGVVAVDEVLAGEQRGPHVGDGPLHPGLVLGPAHPGRVDGEAPGLGVLDEGLVEPGLDAVALSTMRDMLSGITVAEHAAEERPGRLAALDDGLRWSG